MGNFIKDLKTGEVGEKITMEYLSSIENFDCILDVRDNKLFQKIDVDFLVLTKDNIMLPVEVKSDTMAHRTNNIVYETVSNRKTGSIGCFEKTRAKYMYYYLTVPQELYVIDVIKLQEYAHENCTKKVRMGDCAEGYLIKMNALLDLEIMKKVK